MKTYKKVEKSGCQNNLPLQRVFAFGGQTISQQSNAVIDQKLNYIQNNPVEEGLVFRPEDCVYSSAVDYSGEKGLLDVFVIK